MSSEYPKASRGLLERFIFARFPCNNFLNALSLYNPYIKWPHPMGHVIQFWWNVLAYLNNTPAFSDLSLKKAPNFTDFIQNLRTLKGRVIKFLDERFFPYRFWCSNLVKIGSMLLEKLIDMFSSFYIQQTIGAGWGLITIGHLSESCNLKY